MSRTLDGPELVRVSDILAESATNGGVDPSRIAMAVGLPAAGFASSPQPNSTWFNLVRQVHAGGSKKAGDGRIAVARLVEAVNAILAGNSDLNRLAFELGQGTSCCQNNFPRQQSIFLSYASEDRADVNRLFDSLKKAAPQRHVFQDHRMLPGVEWLKCIETNAGETDVMACWLTDNFLKKTFCHFELGIARSHNVTIKPICTDESVLARAPAYVNHAQAIRATVPIAFNAIARQL